MTQCPPATWPNRPIKDVAPGLAVWGYITDVPLGAVIEHIRNWGLWLEDGGCIRVGYWTTSLEAEFRKRRFKKRPDTLTFRYRNADATRASFPEVRRRFDARMIPYELELTPKREHPRALAVTMMADDVLAGQIAGNLLAVALDANEFESLCIGCTGSFRSALDAPPVPLLGQSGAFRTGFKLGQVVGRVLHRRDP